LKGPTEKKKATETAEVLGASGLQSYVPSTDGSVMVQIAPFSLYLNNARYFGMFPPNECNLSGLLRLRRGM
jgi:hypothetical protein